MRYMDHFRGRILTEVQWGDEIDDWVLIEGNIVEESESFIKIEDAWMYTSENRLTRSREVLVNKDYLMYIDSVKKGYILNVARERYHDSLLNGAGYAITVLCSMIFMLITWSILSRLHML